MHTETTLRDFSIGQFFVVVSSHSLLFSLHLPLHSALELSIVYKAEPIEAEEEVATLKAVNDR